MTAPPVKELGWEGMLPRFSLRRRITVLVLMMTGVVVGLVSATGIPLELVPSGYDAPTLTVMAPWRDAPPADMMDKIVLPLEEELSTIGGLDEVGSLAQTGRSFVFLTFKSGTDMDVAYREVRDGVLRARSRMPEDTEQVRILKQSSSSIPVMVIGVGVDPGVADPYSLIQQEIVRPLSRIDGVATVRSDGLQQKEVLIELDREKTEAAGLNVYLVARELSSDNFSLASGAVRHGERKLLLRSIARYDDLQVLRDQLVSSTVRLGDIATVKYAVPEQFWHARVNGKPALAVEVLKEGQANTIEVGARLNKAYQEIRKSPRLQGSITAVLFSQSDVILESLDTLLDSGRLGAIFAVLVLLFFLRRFRLTLIITLSIPLSMVVALTAMYFAGETLNVLTLLGLIISVGLLVDNSVVVAENIYRLYQEGASRREACVRGAGEIALAVVLATLTTIIVFLPVSLVEGQAQFFLMRLAAPVGVSLAASLLVALLVVPLATYLTLGRSFKESQDKESGFVQRVHRFMDGFLTRVYDATLGQLGRAYAAMLRFFLGHRLDLVLGLFALFAVTGAVTCGSIQVVGVSREDMKSFRIQVDLPQNYNLEEASAFFREIEQSLDTVKAELSLDGYLIVHGNVWGRIQGWFPDQETLTPRQVTQRVMEILPKQPGAKYFSGSEEESQAQVKVSEYVVLLTGEDPHTLADVGRALEESLVKIDGVLGIKRSRDMSPSELALVVDRQRAQRQGVSPQIIAGVVASALRGQALPRFHQEGKEIPVRLRFEEDDRQGLAELVDFGVPTAGGGVVQLKSVTDVEFLAAQRGIFRQDKRVSHQIVLDLVEGQEAAARKALDGFMANFDLPEGVRLGHRKAEDSLAEDKAAMRFAAVVSVIFIYFLMGFLFESFLLPASIIFTIPLAGVGVVWTHWFVGRDLDFLGFIGVSLLIGVVVNNGIVLIDYVGRLRQSGMERAQAVMLAASRRFRPIMMTAATTVSGMIPLAVGDPTSIGLSYKSFGLTLISGMITATMLTLLVVPVLYTLLDDARSVFFEVMRRVTRGRDRQVTAVDSAADE